MNEVEPTLGDMLAMGVERRFTRPVSIASDPYLLDHLVGEIPVFPAAYHLALMLHAAQVCAPGQTVIGARQIRFVQPARFRPNQTLTFSIDATPRHDFSNIISVIISSSMAAPRLGFPPIVREHARCDVILGSPLDGSGRFQVLDFSNASDYAELYDLPPEIRHGPAFFAGLRYEHPRPDQLFALVAPPKSPSGPWNASTLCVPATLLNAILHVGFSLAVLHERNTVLPLGIESANFHRVPSGQVQVLARRTALDEKKQRVHVAAWDEQGRHVATFGGFILQTVN